VLFIFLFFLFFYLIYVTIFSGVCAQNKNKLIENWVRKINLGYILRIQALKG